MQVRAATTLRLAYAYPPLDVDFSPDQRWSGSRLEVVSLQFTGIFILNTYLFLLVVSPETMYLYVVYVDLEMIENQCPLRLTIHVTAAGLAI